MAAPVYWSPELAETPGNVLGDEYSKENFIRMDDVFEDPARVQEFAEIALHQ